MLYKDIANGVLAFIVMFILTPPLAGIVPRPVVYATSQTQDEIMVTNHCAVKHTQQIPTGALVYDTRYRMVSFDEGWRAYENKSDNVTLVSFCYKATNPAS